MHLSYVTCIVALWNVRAMNVKPMNYWKMSLFYNNWSVWSLLWIFLMRLTGKFKFKTSYMFMLTVDATSEKICRSLANRVLGENAHIFTYWTWNPCYCLKKRESVLFCKNCLWNIIVMCHRFLCASISEISLLIIILRLVLCQITPKYNNNVTSGSI